MMMKKGPNQYNVGPFYINFQLFSKHNYSLSDLLLHLQQSCRSEELLAEKHVFVIYAHLQKILYLPFLELLQHKRKVFYSLALIVLQQSIYIVHLTKLMTYNQLTYHLDNEAKVNELFLYISLHHQFAILDFHFPISLRLGTSYS